MLEAISNYLVSRTATELLRDLLDIFIVYYLFYRLLLVARGTRAMQVAAGLALIALLYVGGQAMGLVTITTLVGALLQSIILVVVVVFQNDIRRALQRVGSQAFFGSMARAQETEVIDHVVSAAGELARHRIGAIIAFEQDANLNEFIGQNKGIDLDAQVSSELLVSVFIPEGSNKLHDGAVILRDLRIAKAGVFFPMPESRSFDASFGSRHRAAIGITEETDAVVVVVSEERGTISFCFNGNVATDLQADQLRDMLFSIMNPKVRKKSREVARKRHSTDGARTSSESAPPSHRLPSGRLSTIDEPPPSSQSLARSPGGRQSPPTPLRKSALPPGQDATPRRRDEASPPPPAAAEGALPSKTPSPTAVAGKAKGPAQAQATPADKAEDDGNRSDSLTLRAADRAARPMPKGPEVGALPDSDESDDGPRTH